VEIGDWHRSTGRAIGAFVDLASEADTALACATVTAAAHWLLPCDTDDYPPLHVVASGGHYRRPATMDGNHRPTKPPRRPVAAR
jgi:hypothetical protein